MSTQKTYSVAFFQMNSTDDAHLHAVALFKEFVTLTKKPALISIGGYDYDIRSITLVGSVFKGEFAKYRKTGLPHIGKPDGLEKAIPLQTGEGLIEKNYFLLDKKRFLITWQMNRNAAMPNVFASYLTDCLGATLSLNDLVRTGTTQQLVGSNLTLKSIEATIARPLDPASYPEDEFSRDTLKLMESTGGYQVHIKISGEGRGSKKKPLKKIASAIAALVDGGHASVAKLKFEELEREVDLITDRIKDSITVDLPDDRYPDSATVFSALSNAKDRRESELKLLVGT